MFRNAMLFSQPFGSSPPALLHWMSYSPNDLNKDFEYTVCLAPGTYSFDAFDAFKDGWGEGSFSVDLLPGSGEDPVSLIEDTTVTEG